MTRQNDVHIFMISSRDKIRQRNMLTMLFMNYPAKKKTLRNSLLPVSSIKVNLVYRKLLNYIGATIYYQVSDEISKIYFQADEMCTDNF